MSTPDDRLSGLVAIGFAIWFLSGLARQPRVHYASPGPNRWKERSRTLPGIASAMADQWGGIDQISQGNKDGT